jgi:uncharacterized protein (DUF1015 family)
MAEIRAFEALRYAEDVDLAAATCPPYDVLSSAERQRLFDRSPHATVRLILPEGDGDTKYTNAADLLKAWRAEGVLRTDPTPALYVTRTEFSEPGMEEIRHARLGLIALLRLHEYADRVVLPHERTLTGPKADRLNLLRATQANVESIMTLVDDEDSALYREMEAATKNAPLADFTGDDNQRHTLYAITDPDAIARITALVAPKHIYIADGHHRYETSVNYARETGALGTDAPEAFLLATICSHADPGLVVLPTHRLIKGTPSDAKASLFQHLERIFDVQTVDRADLEGRLALHIENQPVFGMILPSGTVYQLTLRDLSAIEPFLPAEIPAPLRSLEPVLLQHLILAPAFALPADQVATTDRLAYTRDVNEAIQRVESGEFDAAFLLGRPAVTAVRDASLADAVMPQKSTFFYPKLLSGLVLRSF